MAFSCPFGMATQHRLVRHRLQHPLDRQARLDERVEDGGDHAVVLPHAGHDPLLFAQALLAVAVQQPRRALLGPGPALARRAREVDRVLRGEHEAPARCEPRGDPPREVCEVLHVVERQRTDDQVEPGRLEGHVLQRGADVGDAGVAALRPREGEHPLREVDADHLGGAGLGEVERPLPGAAPEVQRAQAGHVRQQRLERLVLVGVRPALAEAGQACVPGEELRVVVQVLRFGHRVRS